MSKTIGWEMWEVVGETQIHPLIYVYEIVKKNKSSGTVNASNINELIKSCFDYVPHRKERVLEIVAEAFPQFIDEIDKYRILI